MSQSISSEGPFRASCIRRSRLLSSDFSYFVAFTFVFSPRISGHPPIATFPVDSPQVQTATLDFDAWFFLHRVGFNWPWYSWWTDRFPLYHRAYLAKDSRSGCPPLLSLMSSLRSNYLKQFHRCVPFSCQKYYWTVLYSFPQPIYGPISCQRIART